MTKMNELELQRKLYKESVELNEINTYDMPYKAAKAISAKQDEAYHKWKLLKGIRNAKQKINEEKGDKNGKNKRFN